MLYYIYNNTYGLVWEQKAEYDRLMEISQSGKDYQLELDLLAKKSKDLDAIFLQENVSGGEIQQKIIQGIEGNETFSVKVTNVPAPHIHQYGDYEVTTNLFELEGRYVDLIKSLYFLEEEFKYASLSSVKLYAQNDYNSKSTKLYMIVYLQNIGNE